MKIGRTLFWFREGDDEIASLDDAFFGIALLLNRCLNEIYNGRKIKFINLNFFTLRTYELHPVLPKDCPYFHGGHLTYYGVFDLVQFNASDQNERKHFVWEKACSYVKTSAIFTKNKELLDAVEYAYLKGIERRLNPDYRVLELNVNIQNQELNVALWIKFKEDGMYSILVVEEGKNVIYEKQVDKTLLGVEFFLDMYKALQYDGSDVVIKGRKEVDYLPIRVPIVEIVAGNVSRRETKDPYSEPIQ